MNAGYLRAEILRALRNPRYLLFTIGMPVVLFLMIGNAYAGTVAGVSAATWYMINMGVFGAMGAVLGTGGRIAAERDAGWNRQLRLTPMTPLSYVLVKVSTGMLVALPALLLVSVAGLLTGVHLTALQWSGLIGFTWLALIPLAVVGVGTGYAARGDSAQAVNGGLLVLLSMFGGLWFSLDGAPRWMIDIAHVTPTYWITQIGRAPLTHSWPSVGGWVVLAAWLAVAGRIAAGRYRADGVRAT